MNNKRKMKKRNDNDWAELRFITQATCLLTSVWYICVSWIVDYIKLFHTFL
jgi:hypothetical protein